MKSSLVRASAALVGALALLFDASATSALTIAPPDVPSNVTLAFHGGVHGRPGGYHGRPGVPGGVHRPPPGAYHGRPPGVYHGRPPGYYGGRPGYYGGWRRPGYGWGPGGAIAAGAAIGVLTAGAAAAYASSRPPAPGLCWYYTDSTRRNGFWDACR
jgi:hypothetical protein